MNALYLLDKDFLNKLDNYPHRETYARIISLDINENPLEQIEGRITGGSINIDGSSAVRRTCSLNMITNDININEFLWGIKTKIKLEVGLRNVIDDRYPEIIWFPQGVYIISSFNTSISTNQCQIALQAKDKMCMLNGDLGGNLPSSIDFGKEELLFYNYDPYDLDNKKDYITGKYYTWGELVITGDPEHPYDFIDQYKLYEGRYEKTQTYYYFDRETQEYVQSTDKTFMPGRNYYIKNYVLAMKQWAPIQYYTRTETITYDLLPLYRIIKEAVHAWAKEPYHNIIIKDLDDFGLEQLTYKGEDPLYALKRVTDDTYMQMSIKDRDCYWIEESYKSRLNNEGLLPRSVFGNLETYKSSHAIKLSDFLDESLGYKSEKPTAGQSAIPTEELTWIFLSAPENSDTVIPYTVLALGYGDDAGYRITDLTYTGELISSIGETVTSILDKIKTMLGNYEYFYNLDGQFVFQRKPTYINTKWTSVERVEGETVIKNAVDDSAISYSFIGSKLVTAFNNTPVINNAKNDYSVWGVRKSVSGADLPIHARYAIDKKPKVYKTIRGKIYSTDEEYLKEALQQAYAQTQENVLAKIMSFTPRYSNDLPPGFTPPTRQANGDWAPGWWDIRDWHDFYVLLTHKEPQGTMKWYSHNSLEGCVPVASLITDENRGWISNSYSNHPEYMTWLAVVTPRANGYYYNFGHGGGAYIEDQTISRIYWESVYTNDETVPIGITYSRLTLSNARQAETGYKYLLTTQVRDENDQQITAPFHYPYAGCSDSHTYLSFLEGDVYSGGSQVLFYNPNFPMATFEDLTDQMFEELWQEYLDGDNLHLVDWREIIYQMALDYFRYSNADTVDAATGLPFKDIFLQKVASNNFLLYPTGYTGYEQYYTDIQGFWRQLYNSEIEPSFTYTVGKYSVERQPVQVLPSGVVVGGRINPYQTGYTFQQPYITDVTLDYYYPLNIEIDIRNVDNKKAIQIIEPTAEEDTNYRQPQWLRTLQEYIAAYMKTTFGPTYANIFNDDVPYYGITTPGAGKWGDPEDIENLINVCKKLKARIVKPDESVAYWNTAVFNAPETLNFWFDFLDSESELAAYAVPTIGDRSKVVNDTKVTSIYFKQIPDFIFTTTLDFNRNAYEEKTGYTFLFLPPSMEKLFTISYRGKSAKDEIDNLLYQHSYCIENITVTSVPVYYLIPNTRIFVSDEKTQINGEYIVTKITLPLAHNGTMQITANKAPERLY